VPPFSYPNFPPFQTAADPAPFASSFPVAEQTGKVIANKHVCDSYYQLIVSCDWPATAAEAGQFFHLLCPPSGRDSPFLRRPMSVYGADPSRGTIEFLYKVTGAGTRGLGLLRSGDELNLLGPLGNSFRLLPAWRNIVVVGRGVGLATLTPLATMARMRGVGVTAILSARSTQALVSAERFERSGARVLAVNDADGTSSEESVGQLLWQLIRAGNADAFFTCGSRRLIVLLQSLAAAMNIPGQAAIEQQMACGLGMCFCCVRSFCCQGKIEQRRVCVEGPVFDLAEVLP
jgi:dihydroorotate dehydrogenase electron transfer subunit